MTEDEAKTLTIVEPKTPAAPAADSFKALVRAVELLDVRLVHTEAKINSEQRLPDRDMVLTVAPLEYCAAYNEESSVLYCGIRFAVTEGDDGEKARAEVLRVVAQYDLFYQVPPTMPVSQDAAEMFASQNAAFNAWPFFRELVHSLVGRMGLPPVLVPLQRLPFNQPKIRRARP